MYASQLSIYDFKCFEKTILELQYPGRTGSGTSEINNINLIVGDNGGGKSSVLRALAIGALAPALINSGFVPIRLVRRPGPKEALLKVDAILEKGELRFNNRRKKEIELLARLFSSPSGSYEDRLDLNRTPFSPFSKVLDDDKSPSFFVLGFGATRRIEVGDFSESSARKSRSLKYQRISSLFEDHVAIRPITSWMPRLSAINKRRAISQINKVLPRNIRFSGKLDQKDGQYLFSFEGKETPFSSLSDGYKSFIGWAGELVSHLISVSNPGRPLTEIPGIVLIDEIDLHLHPSWQREVVPALSSAFPKIQFVMTTHSPLVASTVRKENMFVTDTAENGTAIVKQIGESAYGRSVEQLLLSSYFGLTSTRPQQFLSESRTLFERAAKGETNAAIQYLETLGANLEQPRSPRLITRKKAKARAKAKPKPKKNKRLK